MAFFKGKTIEDTIASITIKFNDFKSKLDRKTNINITITYIDVDKKIKATTKVYALNKKNKHYLPKLRGSNAANHGVSNDDLEYIYNVDRFNIVVEQIQVGNTGILTGNERNERETEIKYLIKQGLKTLCKGKGRPLHHSSHSFLYHSDYFLNRLREELSQKWSIAGTKWVSSRDKVELDSDTYGFERVTITNNAPSVSMVEALNQNEEVVSSSEYKNIFGVAPDPGYERLGGTRRRNKTRNKRRKNKRKTRRRK
jgi:hypothetical protein